MAMLFTTKEAFEKVKKYLDTNQYLYTVLINPAGYFVKID